MAPLDYFTNKGNLAVIGRAAGAGGLREVRVPWSGVAAMAIRPPDVSGWISNRLLVFMRWGLQYLTFSRGSRLITGWPLPG